MPSTALQLAISLDRYPLDRRHRMLRCCPGGLTYTRHTHSAQIAIATSGPVPTVPTQCPRRTHRVVRTVALCAPHRAAAAARTAAAEAGAAASTSLAAAASSSVQPPAPTLFVEIGAYLGRSTCYLSWLLRGTSAVADVSERERRHTHHAHARHTHTHTPHAHATRTRHTGDDVSERERRHTHATSMHAPCTRTAHAVTHIHTAHTATAHRRSA
jgi:hypothetical protein